MGLEPARKPSEVFLCCLELAAARREEFLDRQCADDPVLRMEVESLLRAHARANRHLFLEMNGGAGAGRPEDRLERVELGPPEKIGEYRIVREISSGGMGVVYLADHPRMGMQVALKVIKPGMDSRAVVSRFKQEAQALAFVAHPNIARIYDVGITPPDLGSRPYFTMEYVEGEPITAYCDRERLDVRQRLELLIPVCEALQHAHSKGIIHRDIKPSNILVHGTGDSRAPTVIDFGIAKALGPAAWDQTTYTGLGTMIGTPGYMSPEQADAGNADIDTRTDVYSLGVVLYELLVGVLPVDQSRLKSAGLEELRRIIREENSPKPSTRLSRLGSRPADEARTGAGCATSHDPAEIASLRRTTTRELRRVLKGELELVPMKAMRKDRDQRYATAGDLARDLQNYLAGRVLEAAPESAAYVFKKFVLRNRWPVGTGAAVVLALSAGLMVALWGLHRAEMRRQEAEYEQYRSDLTSAEVALEANDMANAGRLLRAAPEGLRGWEWDRLDAECDNSLLELGRVDDETVGRIVSFDGEWFATSSKRNGVQVWGTADGRLDFRFKVSEGGSANAVLSPRGSRLATLPSDGSPRIWSLPEGRVLSVLPEKPGAVNQIVFSGDGRRAATATVDGTARLWDAESGRLVATFNGDAGEVRVGSLNQDGTRLVMSWGAADARLWASDGRPLGGLKGSEAATICAFNSDGTRIVTASALETTARLWDARNGELVAALEGHEGVVLSASFSAEGDRVLTASMDNTARVWKSEDGRPLLLIRRADGDINAALFSPDGSRIATGSTDGSVRLWDAKSGAREGVLRGHRAQLECSAFTADGGRVVSAAMDGTARVWDSRTAATPVELRGHGGQINGGAFAPDGRLVVTASTDTFAHVFDVIDGHEVVVLRGHGSAVWNAAFSPDGSRVVTVSEDMTARLWNVKTGECVIPPLVHGSWINSAAFSPDGTLVVTASGDKSAGVWDVVGGRRMATLPHPKAVRSAVFSPEGRVVASGCDDGTLRLWDWATEREVRAIRAHDQQIICVSFDRDGKRLLTTSADNTARVWDVAAGRCVLTLVGHEARVMSAFFNPDMSRVVTSSWDGTVRLWDSATGREMAIIRDTHKRHVNWAVFSGDGTRLLVATPETTALIHDGAAWRTRYTELRALGLR